MIVIKRPKKPEIPRFQKPDVPLPDDDDDMIENAIYHRFQDMDHDVHLCYKCERYLSLDYDRTTQDTNACKYAYSDGVVQVDNGMGYWIAQCPHFTEMDTRHLYKRWMKTDAWRKIAAEKKKRALYKCELCGSAINLCVHHTTYENLCREFDHMEDLIVVCKSCHEALHEADMRQTNEVKE